MPWNLFSKQYQILLLLLIFVYEQQQCHGIIHDAPNIYQWMERNSYICDLFDPSKSENPIFIFEEEADIFRCSELCGDPIETKKACGRMRSLPDSDPSCFTIPEICLREYIHEFNTTSHNAQKENEVNESFDDVRVPEIDQNNLEPVDLAVVNEPIISNNNAEINVQKIIDGITTTTERPTTSSSTTTTSSTTPSTTTTTTTVPQTTTITPKTTTFTTTVPSTTTTESTTIPTTAPTTTTEQTTTSTTTLAPTTTISPTTTTSTTTTTPSTTTTVTTTTISSTTMTSPSTTTTTTTPIKTTTTTPSTTTTTTQSTTIPTTTTEQTTTSTTTLASTTTTSTTTSTPSTTTTTPITTTTTTTISSTTTTPTTTQFSTKTTAPSTTTSTREFTNPTTNSVPFISTRPTFHQTQRNIFDRQPPQHTTTNFVFIPSSTTTVSSTPFVKNISPVVSVTTQPRTVTHSHSTMFSPTPTTPSRVFTTTSTSTTRLTPSTTTRPSTSTISTTRFVPSTTTPPSRNIFISTSGFPTLIPNNDHPFQASQSTTPFTTTPVPSTSQPQTRASFLTTLKFSNPQTTQFLQQQTTQFLQRQSTTRFVPTTTTTTTVPFASTPRSTTSNFVNSQLNNPRTTQFFQQPSSNFRQQQTSTPTIPPTPSTSSPPTTITTTTSTVFIRPIERTTPTFGRFVLATARAVNIDDFRNQTDILRKIKKQQKIFSEFVRDSTLTTRNIPFTTPEENKIIVDKRLQKLDETVKRFRTATPPFGFRLVSSLPTNNRPTRSTTFRSTSFLRRTTEMPRHFVDKDLKNPTIVPSQTVEDRFKKFEGILPKRIMGNNNGFRQIVFPTTTSSTRPTRSTTSRRSDLFVVDGEISGDHFVFNEVPSPDLRDVVFGKVPSASSSSSTTTSTASATLALSSVKSPFPKPTIKQSKRKIFFFRNRHSGEMVIAPQDDECVDGDTACDFWAKNGECKANPVYMLTVCRLSCHTCTPFFS